MRCAGAGTTGRVEPAATFHALIDECPNWFVGRVAWRADAGDHDAFLLEPVAAENSSGEDEFTFHFAKRIDAGHEA